VLLAWSNMRERCNNPNHKQFHAYGGRGISVCSRWNDAAQFVADMLPTWTQGTTLDRTDNNAGYSPENCAWVPQRANVNNRRNTLFVMRGGVPVPRAVAAETEGHGRSRNALKSESFKLPLRGNLTGDLA
jgi:hypothetical protein